VVAAREHRRIGAELGSLASALATVDIGPGAADLADDRDRLVTALRSYLIPRIMDPSGPLTVVLAGPTGSGKSTLVNSLTGRDLAETGALRPTTTSPVALTAPDKRSAFASIGGVPCDVIIGSAPILESMVLIDTPDIDSTARDHRVAAETLIDHADVVIFVTSALRYADDVAWQVLRRAGARGIEVIHVLNRVSADNTGAVVDYRARLRAEGLEQDLVTIPEHHVPVDGQIPSLAVRSLARRLARIAAARAETSSSIVTRVRDVTLRQVADLANALAVRNEDLDALSAEVDLSLGARAGRLDLSDAAPGVVDAPPEPGRRMAMWRWRRRNRPGDERLEAIEAEVIDAIAAVVHGDVRSWAGNADAVGDIDLVSIQHSIRIKVEGWVRFVSRMVWEVGVRDPGLLEVVVLQAALGVESTLAVERLSGDDALALIARATRELETRVGSIYDAVAGHVVASHRDRLGRMDDTDLRNALGTVMAAPSLIDA
jgi:energy-coupling factor transporter ATP-binding protein EcfA2